MDGLLAPRVVGSVIILGFAFPAVGFAIVARRGLIRGIEAAFRGVEGYGSDSRALRVITGYWIPGTILLIVGLGLLALLLARRGDPGFSMIAYGLVAFGLVLAILEGTFQASVTTWAGYEWAASNEVPELFEQLRLWLNLWLQRVWVPMALVGSIGFGYFGIRYGVLSPWVGWPGIAVSGVVLIQMITAGAVIVALAFVPILLFGTALLIFG